MPQLHLKRANTKTTNKQSRIINVAQGAIVRPLSMVNSHKQRLTTLFFAWVFAATIVLTPIVYYGEAQAAKIKPSQLAVAKQDNPQVTGELGKGSTLTANEPSMDKAHSKPSQRTEIISERTENSESFDLGNGQREVRKYFDKIHYKNNGQWEKVDNKLVEDANAADSNSILGKAVSLVKSKTQKLQTYKLAANDWQARFAPSDDKVGMVRIESGSIKLKYVPINTAKAVSPEIVDEEGKQVVFYRDIWKDIDLRYTVKGGALKEDIIVKSKSAETQYAFKVSGANLVKNSEGGFKIEGTEQELAGLSLELKDRGPINESRVTQSYDAGVLTIKLEAQWLAEQPESSFPMIIDPTWRQSPTVGWNYTSYKSDGYVCSPSVCYMNAGSLYDRGWKTWRTVFWVSMPELPGKQIIDANLYLNKRAGIGTTEGLYTEVSRAACWGFNCIDYGSPRHSAWFGSNGVINITPLLQRQANIGDTGPTYIINGEERAYTTRKGFDADASYINYIFNTAPNMASATAPANGQVVVTDQPLLSVNAPGDPNGDAVKYYFRVSDKPGAETGSVINSGWIDSTQWTIPEGRLQDGVTYYWHTYTYDGYWQTNPNWTWSFKYDARLGNDSAASFDDGGPVDINLATGNTTTSAGTHGMSALGGSVGLNFEYNSPYRSKPGLTAEYFNNTGWSGSPSVVRTETNLNFPWSLGTPATGVINADNFSMRLKGYFVAPRSGNYQFGFTADDYYALYLNNEATPAVSAGCCSNGNWSMGARYFTEGQIVPMRMDYIEATGLGYLHIAVRIDGAEQQVQTNWLRTEPKIVAQNNGLMGKYYYSDASRTFPADEFSSFLQRRETNMYFNWGEGTPVASGPVDNWMARYTGYFTAPVAGTYYFGTGSDDGSRIYLNGATTPYLNDWADSGWNMVYGGGVQLSAGQSIPITAEFYEYVGAASFGLYVKGAVAEQIIPSTWLSTKINPLPAGWQMSADADGDLAYDYAAIGAQDIVLYDAEGDSHTYKLNGSTYTPPVNEYGYLTKNANGSLTLLDSDGTTYNFGSAGRIVATSTPTDDRKPASLRYEYGGTPVRLQKIIDGVDASRTGTVYYSGANECGAVPSGFDSNAPFNMVCAFKTTDGQTTNLYYKNGLLARINSNGDVNTDIGYDSLGRIISQRSSTAYDVIVAGVRQDNASLTSQIEYDAIGRASAITLPSATEDGFRAKHTYKYLSNVTLTNEVGEVEPKGYSQRIEYDSLYRTTKAYAKDGNATQQEWDSVKDLLLSSTDATGLKSTTLYDANDLPIDSYGPAPSAWFGADRKPLAANISQVPRVQTNYDEGMKGAAVAWFDYSTASGGALIGAPRYHKTGFGGDQQAPDLFWQDSTTQAAPIEKSANANGVGFTATGTVTFPTTGAYTFQINHEDAARLYVNDALVIDDWAYRSQTIKQSYSAAITLEANKPYRFKYDYGNADNGYMAFSMRVKGPGIDLSTGNPFWGSIMKPAYSLSTSTKVYDSLTGDTVTKTDYGTQPELGQAKTVTENVGSLNLSTSFTYEPYQASSLMRQTSKTMPGGNTYTYLHYDADQVRENPCVENSPKVSQAGFAKGKIEPDPDGAGPQTPRTSESVYDASGRVVATRYNNDPWTCTSYDDRGRVASTVIPAIADRGGRTISNNYAVNGNPLITSTTDNTGSIVVETDLLGRNVSYKDAHSNVTTSSYDNAGRLISRTSPLGEETYVYDDYDRIIAQKLDTVTLATVTYDTFSRIASVQYPTANQQKLGAITRDALGRVNSLSYTLGDGAQTITDQINRSVTGDILSGTENGVAKSYTYDGAGRLTAATIGTNSYSYGFGATTAAQCSQTSANLNAGKNGNRTTQTVNGVTTNYCYDYADRLLAGSDPSLAIVEYDDHGNTTAIGTADLPMRFAYDASDRNTGIVQRTEAGNGIATYYTRDVQNRIMGRYINTISDWTWKAAGDSYYGFTGSGDTPDFIRDNDWNVVEKYVTLPGNVLLTIRPNETDTAKKQTFSLPNIHGDVFATTNATGTLTGTTLTGPFGERIEGQVNPANSDRNSTYSYVGQHQKLTETNFTMEATQMGARVYLAVLGRFMQVDSVEGGTDNAYAYVNDPVNDFDLDGTFSFKKAFGKVAAVASIAAIIPGPIGMAAAGVSAAAYAAAGDGRNAAIMAGTIALAAVGAGAVGVAAKMAPKAMTAAKTIKAVMKIKPVYAHSSAGASRQITGYTSHAIGRMAGTRGGPQMSPQMVKYIVSNGKRSYNAKHDSWNYKHAWGNVSLNQKGRVTTVVAKKKFTRYVR